MLGATRALTSAVACEPGVRVKKVGVARMGVAVHVTEAIGVDVYEGPNASELPALGLDGMRVILVLGGTRVHVGVAVGGTANLMAPSIWIKP